MRDFLRSLTTAGLLSAGLLATALPGHAQHALRFVGADADQVLVPLPAPTGSFTLEAWVKYTDATYVGGHNTIVEFDNDEPYFGIMGTGALELYTQQTSSPVLVPTGSWHHVACAFNRAAGTVALYLDGVLVGTNPSATLSVPTTTTMGIGYNFGDWGWRGEIDEVMVWNTPRTPAQIQADRAGYQVAQAGMLAYFKFDEGVGQTVTNLVAGGPNGVLGTTIAVELKDPQWTNSNVVATPYDLPAPAPALALAVSPNPAAGSATITYELPAAAPSVHLTITDALGREVTRFVRTQQPAGTHTVPFEGRNLPAGLYTCSLTTATGRRTTRLVLTR